MLDSKKLIARAEMLYSQLGDAGLSRASLEELAKMRQADVPFRQLSADLRRSLLTIVRNYDEGCADMEMREALAERESEPPLMTSESETTNEEPTEKPADETTEQPAP